ncbi:MAG: metallophosphoesterase [Firmicutes bacterium]|nr:metallophosphoesterase [Bacillota bacterium]
MAQKKILEMKDGDYLGLLQHVIGMKTKTAEEKTNYVKNWLDENNYVPDKAVMRDLEMFDVFLNEQGKDAGSQQTGGSMAGEVKKVRKFVVGDLHGQLDEFIELEKYVKQMCDETGHDYEIICTGDIMDRGEKSYELYQYFESNPKLKQILGNHDVFYKSDEHLYFTEGICTKGFKNALHPSNGGEETLKGIFRHIDVQPNKVKIEGQISNSAFYNATYAMMNVDGKVFSFDTKKVEINTNKCEKKIRNQISLFKSFISNEKIDKAYKDIFGKVVNFLQNLDEDKLKTLLAMARGLDDMEKYFDNLPHQMVFEDEKVVLSHSGWVMTNDDGTIKKEEDLTENDKFEITWGQKDDGQNNRTRQDGSSHGGGQHIVDRKINGYTVVYGHKQRGVYDGIAKIGDNNELESIVLDGNGGHAGGTIRFVELNEGLVKNVDQDVYEYNCDEKRVVIYTPELYELLYTNLQNQVNLDKFNRGKDLSAEEINDVLQYLKQREKYYPGGYAKTVSAFLKRGYAIEGESQTLTTDEEDIWKKTGNTQAHEKIDRNVIAQLFIQSFPMVFAGAKPEQVKRFTDEIISSDDNKIKEYQKFIDYADQINSLDNEKFKMIWSIEGDEFIDLWKIIDAGVSIEDALDGLEAAKELGYSDEQSNPRQSFGGGFGGGRDTEEGRVYSNEELGFGDDFEANFDGKGGNDDKKKKPSKPVNEQDKAAFIKKLHVSALRDDMLVDKLHEYMNENADKLDQKQKGQIKWEMDAFSWLRNRKADIEFKLENHASYSVEDGNKEFNALCNKFNKETRPNLEFMKPRENVRTQEQQVIEMAVQDIEKDQGKGAVVLKYTKYFDGEQSEKIGDAQAFLACAYTCVHEPKNDEVRVMAMEAIDEMGNKVCDDNTKRPQEKQKQDDEQEMGS